jgi:hypothetical protein
MISALAEKKVIVAAPGALIDNTSATTTAIDTLGYDYLVVDVILGATDIAVSALKLQESDTLSGSDLASGTDVPGAVYGTSDNDAGSTSSLPSATDDTKIFGFAIDLRGRKRYIDLVATLGDGTSGGYLAALGTLSRASTAPSGAAEAGYSQRLIA